MSAVLISYVPADVFKCILFALDPKTITYFCVACKSFYESILGVSLSRDRYANYLRMGKKLLPRGENEYDITSIVLKCDDLNYMTILEACVDKIYLPDIDL